MAFDYAALRAKAKDFDAIGELAPKKFRISALFHYEDPQNPSDGEPFMWLKATGVRYSPYQPDPTQKR